MDRQQQILEQVRAALEAKSPLALQGGGTKSFYGNPSQGAALELSGHSGVVEYDPGELVITCRAGTRLAAICELLAQNGQYLPFEPPAFGDSATIGGTVACGLSGPGRPWNGGLRDYLLGAKIINGRGEVLAFGGQVMKNVAGYDVSRLMAGSMGTLGVILEVSFKVLPRPARELTLVFKCGQAEAIRRVNRWSALPLPLSAASWHDGRLSLRLSGAVSQTEKAAEQLAADELSENQPHWRQLREHELDFFATGDPLWRLSVPPACPALDLDGDCLLDWGGAQRWYTTAESPGLVRAAAETAGGHATLFRGGPETERFHPPAPAMAELQKRVKQAFDPHGLFNPYRMNGAW